MDNSPAMLAIAALQTASYNISLMYALVWTINSHYASDSTKPLTIVQLATRDESRGIHNDLIDDVLGLASSASRIKFLLEGERLDETAESVVPLTVNTESVAVEPARTIHMQTTAIWLLDSIWAYYRLERRLVLVDGSFKRNGYYCIVYTGQERDRLDTIKLIFRRLFAIYVINVNVFVENRQTGQVQVYSYYPYRSQRCQSSQPVHYATFYGGLGTAPQIHVDNHTLFFDHKLDDMHGCPLVIVTMQHRPFVIIENDDNAPNGRRMHGIEGMLFYLLAERMNFSIQIIEQTDHDRGIVLPNGTITGAMRRIVDGEANITFGAFMYSQERALYMLPTITYTSFPIVLVVPGGHQLSPLQRLTKPLGDMTWLCVLCSFILGLGLIGVLQVIVAVPRLRRFLLGENNRMPCLALWCTLLGGLHQYPARRNFARYLLMLWLLQTLVLRAAYTGELYIMLQDGRVKTPLRSLSQVLAKNYIFHMLPTLEIIFRDMLPADRIVVVPTLYKSLEQLRDDENDVVQIVAPLLQPTVDRFNVDSGPDKPHLSQLPDPLLTAPLTFFMRQHSYLKQRINKLLINMMSAGLVHRFRRMYLDRIEHMAVMRKPDREPTQLTLWLLAGIFGSIAILQFIACIVFLLELGAAAPHRQRLRRFMDAANRYVA
ncbi:hypothetical protein ACLKA6_008130 [Drosophila palustris]